MLSDSGGIGERIRAIRQQRGLTQKQLAHEARVGESALRSYELGDRQPKQGQLEKIAMALRVRPEALNPTDAYTDMEVIYALFEFEDMGAIEPAEGGVLKVNNNKHTANIYHKAIKDWADKKAALDAGDISAEKYIEWKHTYNPSTTLSATGKPVRDKFTGL